MKSSGIFLILFLGISLQLAAQAIPDVAQLKIGDSLAVEILIQKKHQQIKKDASLFYTKEEKEIFDYSLVLLGEEAGVYKFQTSIRRFRSKYDLDYAEERDKKREEHRSFDSSFDVPGYPDRKELTFLNQAFELLVYPEKFSHQILLPEELEGESAQFASTSLNPQGIQNHISSIFLVKSQPIDKGSITARRISPMPLQKVRIKGSISQALSGELLFSGKQGYGAPSTLSPYDRKIALNESGEFELEYEIKEGRFIYLFHHHPELKDNSHEAQISFPLYIEPGDEVEISIDGQAGDELIFGGKSANKYRAFHEFSLKYLGSNTDYWQRILPFPGLSYSLESNGEFKPIKQDQAYLEAQYKSMLTFLEAKKQELGHGLYQRMKAETIYSYARRMIATHRPFPNKASLKLHANEGLTLSDNKEYYLDSMGLDLKAVIQSHAYTDYLYEHLAANIQFLISKDIVRLPGRMQAYHFARFAYRDFALLSLLKRNILSDLRVAESSLNFKTPQEQAGEDDILNEELNLIIKDFLAICSYQPYVEEVQRELERIRRFRKGQMAPDMALGEGIRLSDYAGQKRALIMFRELSESKLSMLQDLQKQYPDIQFIFINTLPFQQAFEDETKDKVYPGGLFYLPAYGSSAERPYHYSGFRGYKFFLIDQHGEFWGSELSRLQEKAFKAEVEELAAFQPNELMLFYERNQKSITQIFWWTSGLFNLLLLYFLFYLRPKRKRERLKAQRIETELRAIRSQMNPHFLFNSLSSVQNLINQAEPERANYYLSRFSQLVRKVLNHSEQAMVPLADELKVVDLYCELEALRFKFEYQIETDPNIDVQLTEVPSMLIQPYVENAVRHGIAMQAGSGRIRISVKEASGFIRIEVEDNGMGIRKHMQEVEGKTEKSGFGLRLSEERIEKINERYNLNIAVAIYDRRDDEEVNHGTRVVINIPMET